MKKMYLLLAGLIPLFYSCNNNNYHTCSKLQDLEITNNEEEPSDEACTVMYVGKDLSKNGKSIIARSSDAGPNAMNMNMTIFEHNALANKIVDSHKGFSYKMPSTTYRYISTPRNPTMNKGHKWEVSAINENGVGVSATLSCYSRAEIVGKDGIDKLVPTGIGEDNIAEIVGATARTAREGIETIAHIIDTQGSVEMNAVMTIDQNEAWYMEIYSGHQYAAVKMPDDKILTAGNEFVLDSLEDMGIKEEDTILSKDLFNLVKDEEFVSPEDCTSIRDLDLAETYKDPYEKDRLTNDNHHRRTWRGYNLFSKNVTEYKDKDYLTYKTGEKYPAFYDIDEGTKLDIHDVERFMRDRFEDILSDPYNDNYPLFSADAQDNKLRYIGIENAYQIHIIQSDSNLPKYIAATEWVSFSNANYSPFLPISVGVNNLPDYYTRVSKTYGYDDKSAPNIYKKLNTLARVDRTNYGIHVQEFWEQYEYIWDEQYKQLLDKTSSLNLKDRREIITNYINKTLNTAIKTALFMIDDLTWHMMSDQTSFGDPTEYRPCVNVKDYAHIYGYSYRKNGKTVTLKKGKENYLITQINEGYRPEDPKDYRPLGEISFNDTTKKLDMVISDEEVYIPISDLKEFIKGDIILNVNDYKTPFNHLVWIIPVSIGVPVIGCAVVYFIIKKRKTNRMKHNQDINIM